MESYLSIFQLILQIAGFASTFGVAAYGAYRSYLNSGQLAAVHATSLDNCNAIRAVDLRLAAQQESIAGPQPTAPSGPHREASVVEVPYRTSPPIIP